MKVDQTLVDAAVALLEQRFPAAAGIAAAMYTHDGAILTSVVFEPEWGGAGLCAEAGAICEAVKLNRRITASVCVSRASGDGEVVILTPCGICQERLFHWGDQVEVATPDPGDARKWVARALAEVQPYYWAKPLQD